jgi:hypothetical protein
MSGVVNSSQLGTKVVFLTIQYHGNKFPALMTQTVDPEAVGNVILLMCVTMVVTPLKKRLD